MQITQKTKTYTLDSKLQTRNLATRLAQTAQKGDIFLLEGDLGAGKTTFARNFIQFFLGEKAEVVSPTFTLVQVYTTPKFPIWHFDLYRLHAPDELFELGVEQAFSEGVSLIEWPERLEGRFQERACHMAFKEEKGRRFVELKRIST